MCASANELQFVEWKLRLGNRTFPVMETQHDGNIFNIPSRFICKKYSVVNHVFGKINWMEIMQIISNNKFINKIK